MKIKTLFISLLITAVLLIPIWLISTPARAADSDTIVIITTTIGANGSGKNRWEVNGKLLEQEETSMTIDEVCNEAYPETFSTNRIETRGGIKWCILEGSFDDLDQLSSGFYNQFDASINQLEIRSNTLYYDLDFNPNISSGTVNVEWKIVAPGKIVDHNADKISGCTLSWKLKGTGSQNIQLESKTNGGCSSSTFAGNTRLIIGIVACCCCLVLIVVIVVVVIFVMKRKRKGAGI
jgi:hypothetical protein